MLIDSETLGTASLAQVLQHASVPATVAMINSRFGLSLPDTQPDWRSLLSYIQRHSW